MKLPWVPRILYDTLYAMNERLLSRPERETYEAVCAERDWLRERCDRLLEHNQRMSRVEHGVGEIPRQPREPFGPAPKRLLAYCNAFASPVTCKENRDVIFRRRAKGESWAEIEADILKDEPEGEKDA